MSFFLFFYLFQFFVLFVLTNSSFLLGPVLPSIISELWHSVPHFGFKVGSSFLFIFVFFFHFHFVLTYFLLGPSSFFGYFGALAFQFHIQVGSFLFFVFFRFLSSFLTSFSLLLFSCFFLFVPS